jgi:regulator of protease activity HflC (stomatin/prohibitin superfamily)
MELMVFDWLAFAVPILLILLLLFASVWIFREYERGVVFTLGRYTRVAGPGLVLIIPVVQQAVRTDLRTFVEDVPPQDVISHDNVSVKVNAVIYFRIVDPQHAIINVANFREAVSQLAQTTLRSVLGKHDLDEMLAERDKLNADIQEILDRQTDAWGIKVANVEIKHVDIDPQMVRAIAKQAEAERLRRARVINAEGEQQAAAMLVEAGRMLGEQPNAMQLRYLNSLADFAGERASTVILPLPMDLLHKFSSSGQRPTPDE